AAAGRAGLLPRQCDLLRPCAFVDRSLHGRLFCRERSRGARRDAGARSKRGRQSRRPGERSVVSEARRLSGALRWSELGRELINLLIDGLSLLIDGLSESALEP